MDATVEQTIEGKWKKLGRRKVTKANSDHVSISKLLMKKKKQNLRLQINQLQNRISGIGKKRKAKKITIADWFSFAVYTMWHISTVCAMYACAFLFCDSTIITRKYVFMSIRYDRCFCVRLLCTQIGDANTPKRKEDTQKTRHSERQKKMLQINKLMIKLIYVCPFHTWTYYTD